MSTFYQRRVHLPVSYVRTRGCGLVEDNVNAGDSPGQKDDSGDDSDVDEVDSAAPQVEVDTSCSSIHILTDGDDGPTASIGAAFTLMTLSALSPISPTPDVTSSEAESDSSLNEDTISDLEWGEYDANESCSSESDDEYGLSDVEYNTSSLNGRIDFWETNGVETDLKTRTV